MPAGRTVTGRLVQDADGIWHEEDERLISKDHLKALQVDFVRSAWAQEESEELKRHVFRVDNLHHLDSGEMLLLCAEQFGWHGRVATLHRQLVQCLLDGGIRIRPFQERAGGGSASCGTSHLPTSLAGIEEL